MLKSVKRLTSYVNLVCLVTLLAACGGGDSSSGGGQDFSGTYPGAGTGTVTVGGGTFPFGGSFVIVIAPNGTVSYREMGMTLGTGTMLGNKFLVDIPASTLNQPGLSCTGLLKVEGEVVGTQIKVTFSSKTVRCNGAAVTITGTGTATKNAKAGFNSFIDQMGDAIKQQY